MADTPTDVLVGGYPDIDAATKDFDALAKARRGQDRSKIEAAILITHAEDGTVTVAADGRSPRPQGRRVGRHRGRPRRPRRAAAARGHGRGRGRGRPDREVRRPARRDPDARQDRREPAARHGGDHRGVRRLAAARRRAGAAGSAREVDRPDGQEGPEGAQGRPRRGDGQVRARPHRAADPGQDLRRDDRVARSTRRSPTGRSSPGRRPPRARRTCCSSSSTTPGSASRTPSVGRSHAEPDARRPDGPHLQPLPRRRALLADPRVHAHRPQPAPRRHGLGRRVPRPVPRLHGRRPEDLRPVAAHPAGERLRHGRVRQVAHDAGPRAGRRGAVRPLAAGLGLRPLLGLPQRRRRPVGSRSSRWTTRTSACPRAPTASRTTSRTT